MNKVLLIDGNSLMFRAFYATAYTGNLMQNKSGLYTNAIFGFCNMIQKLVDESVDKVFVAFDAGKQTFRHKQFDDYKGGRKPMPDEFKVQIPYIKKYLDLMNIKHYECLDYEADDLVAAYANLLNTSENEVYVVSGDKDLLQLAKGNITVCLTKKGITELDEYTESNFKEKMGFESYQVPDYKGLVGDSSDNLPGIKGIGEKTAIKLLDQYHTLENIINNVNELKGKVQSCILEHQELGLKCKLLATLKSDFEVPYSLDEINRQNPNYKELIDFFKQLDFNSFLKKIEKELINNEAKELTNEINQVQEKQFDVNEIIVVDEKYDFSHLKDSYIVLETIKENYCLEDIIGISILSEDLKYKLFVYEDVLFKNESLKQYLEGPNNKKTFDYKKLYVSLKRKGININNVVYDAMLAIYLINPSYVHDDIKMSIENFIDTNLSYDENIFGHGQKIKVPETLVLIEHSISKCFALVNSEKEILENINSLDQNDLLNTELNLSKVLGDMELNGLKVDVDVLKSIGEELQLKQKEVEQRIYEIAGMEFNINSVKQLGEVLFERLSLPSGKKNKTGYSTSVEVLEKLAPNFEIARLVLEYRAVSKIISTYVNGLIDLTNENNFVHPLYKQALTQTGRLSSVNPNIQNMPIRTEMGQVIRKAFVSRFENGKILSCDYSQIELRVLAHMSDDQPMIDSFNSSEDFHTNTASWLYEVDPKDVTKDMRRTAKAINFGIVYGMSAWGLSESINITPFEANMYIMKYFNNHFKVREYLDNVINDAKNNGYTKTLFNRVRYIPELQSSNKNLMGFGERTAMNAPIQGTAADIIKKAMVKVSEVMKGMKSILIAQVHDELLFDVYPSELEQLQKIVKETMENVVELKVPLLVDGGAGDNWLES